MKRPFFRLHYSIGKYYSFGRLVLSYIKLEELLMVYFNHRILILDHFVKRRFSGHGIYFLSVLSYICLNCHKAKGHIAFVKHLHIFWMVYEKRFGAVL